MGNFLEQLHLLDTLQTMRTPWADSFFSAYSALGNAGAVWIVLAAVCLLRAKTRRTGIAVSLALLYHLILVNLFLKPTVDRPRPCELTEIADPLLHCLTDGSFPSGHTGAAFATAAVFLFWRLPGRWFLLAAAALMGISRLYLFVHFPTDVLFAVPVGLFLGWAAVRTVEWWERRRTERSDS